MSPALTAISSADWVIVTVHRAHQSRFPRCERCNNRVAQSEGLVMSSGPTCRDRGLVQCCSAAEGVRRSKKRKGCGLGYALATNSCEGVSSADARTVAAPDAITAFAVPNPSSSSQGSWFFRVWWLNESPRRANHPAYFGLVKFTWTSPFSRRLSQLKRPKSEMQ